MKVELKSAENADREIITNLWQYYIYDMAGYSGWPASSKGLYGEDTSFLDEYWDSDNHYPYLIFCDRELAGFSLLRQYPYENGLNDVGQFFIISRFKGSGAGREAFNLSVSRHPGKWLTRVLCENRGAFKFWTTVIREITGNSFTVDQEIYNGREMHFIRYEIQSTDSRFGE